MKLSRKAATVLLSLTFAPGGTGCLSLQEEALRHLQERYEQKFEVEHT